MPYAWFDSIGLRCRWMEGILHKSWQHWVQLHLDGTLNMVWQHLSELQTEVTLHKLWLHSV